MTWRTMGAMGSDAWAAPHATSSTTMSGDSGSIHDSGPAERCAKGEPGPENNGTCPSKERRTTSLWSTSAKGPGWLDARAVSRADAVATEMSLSYPVNVVFNATVAVRRRRP